MQPLLPPGRGWIAAFLLVAAVAAACGDNALPDHAISDDHTSADDLDGGDVVGPRPDDADAAPADDALPDPDVTVEALIASCGDGALRVDAPLARAPFVQQVTATSAIVGWGTTAGGEQRVELTRPAGQPVMTVASVVEVAAVPMSGMQLRWATLEGLSPDTVYCYALASGPDAFTVRAGFRTAPARDRDRTLRFVALGDSGTGNSEQRAVFEQMRTQPQELIIHVGDVAYSSGTPDQFQRRVFAVYAPLLRFVPMFAVAGNHEYVTADAAPFRDAFALPGNERWYSFDWGSVHFAALDTEQSLSTQAAWLDADLAATDRPWKIVFFHRPPYSSGDHGSATDVRTRLAPVLERHGVQLVLTGHDHHYERTTPQNGVTYVVTGGAGGNLRPVGSSAFTAVAVSRLHFVQVEVSRDQLTLRAIDPAGVAFDTVDIPREP
ncbi:MAG: metallophosphoesterase family protein [Kofleriaceae bacterium]|nr:MAG: metallophosphoesterase family protein [Kofleriaceae bacterium]MBZ0233094.1 metallophosphoesterase [Kofleriaceae bacterium]